MEATGSYPDGTYTSGGTAQLIKLPTNFPVDSTPVTRVIDTTTFAFDAGISTQTNLYNRGGVVRRPLKVIIDDPLPYSQIDFTYSSDSVTGVGTGGKVDIVVGQGSSVISFKLLIQVLPTVMMRF